MILHIFNPSHEEALGFGSPYYVPTKAAQRLTAERCTLPLLWAKPGDAILIPDEYLRTETTINHVTLLYKREFTPKIIERITEIKPWGWNAYLRHSLRRMGFKDHLLPTDQYLNDLRTLSSRETAVKVLKKLQDRHYLFEGKSQWCTNEEDAWSAIKQYGIAMAKSPWSNSGRGVFRVEAVNNVFPAHERIANIIKQYGGISIERHYQRLVDFAIEYNVTTEGEVLYIGISIFKTSLGGNYIENIQGSQDELHALLNTHIAQSALEDTISIVGNTLQQYIRGAYEGPLGVDMMVIQTNTGVRIHPCVEINFRNTMGHVAIFREQQSCLR